MLEDDVKNWCPNCGTQLVRKQDQAGLSWHCPACNGQAVTVAMLRKTVLRDAINEVWQAAVTQHATPGRPCPECGHRMVEVESTAGIIPVKVDVCCGCTLVWFDKNEHEILPELPPVPAAKEAELPQEAREAFAIAKVQAMAERARREASNDPPPQWWAIFPALLGMPVESDAPSTLDTPWATWVLAALTTFISITVMVEAPDAIHKYGMIPSQAFRYGGLTLITSFFLHGGLIHLIGNMYFLLVVGDNVEDALGVGRYFFLLLCATLIGNCAHIFGNVGSTVPCIGASGGIAGLLTYYALAYPQARFALLIRFGWLNIPAYGLVLLWVLLQVVGVWQQINGFSNVSALAHLGGAATGLIFWILWRNPHAPEKTW